jgi:hypothetical protein
MHRQASGAVERRPTRFVPRDASGRKAGSGTGTVRRATCPGDRLGVAWDQEDDRGHCVSVVFEDRADQLRHYNG